MLECMVQDTIDAIIDEFEKHMCQMMVKIKPTLKTLRQTILVPGKESEDFEESFWPTLIMTWQTAAHSAHSESVGRSRQCSPKSTGFSFGTPFDNRNSTSLVEIQSIPKNVVSTATTTEKYIKNRAKNTGNNSGQNTESMMNWDTIWHAKNVLKINQTNNNKNMSETARSCTGH